MNPSDVRLALFPDGARDSPANSEDMTFPPPTRGLYFHIDIDDSLGRGDNERLRKRLGLVLQHLAVYGRTPNVKGVRGKDNEGWRRSPLGGNGGMHYYLWWAPQGSRQVAHLDLNPGDIVVRAVRHHDDVGVLSAGSLGDYLPVRQKDFGKREGFIPEPWSDAQVRFIDSTDPVRVLAGSPGSGKTSALYRAVETRAHQNVLYLTWSRDLAEHARLRFRELANDSLSIHVQDYATFLADITGRDVPRVALRESQRQFRRIAARFGLQNLGVWRDRPSSLHAELRAYLFGRAVLGEEGVRSDGAIARLTHDRYHKVRGSRGGVGPGAAEDLVRVLVWIDRSDVDLETVFPELVAATEACRHLLDDRLPTGMQHFDRIVVDEVQDLTLMELAVIVELVRAVARRRGAAPCFLLAGDDAQTVRPSGFEWGPYKNLLARKVAAPKRFDLEDNVRSPERIAGVLQAASDRYGALDRWLRPTHQHFHAIDPDLPGRVFRVRVPSVQEGTEVLAQLAEIDGTAVVVPSDRIPSWVAEQQQAIILTPAEVKGLEYQVVCVLDPGMMLLVLDRKATESSTVQMDQHELRTSLDQLRVALSRATETLVLLDVDSDPDKANAASRATRDLLGSGAETVDAIDLVKYLSSGDHASVEERAHRWMAEARALLDERPDTAWHRAVQAMDLVLKSSHDASGVLRASLRAQVLETLLSVAARMLLDGLPGGVTRQGLSGIAYDALDMLGKHEDRRAFRALDRWLLQKQSTPFELLNAALALGEGGGWLAGAIVSVRQRMLGSLDALAGDSRWTASFAGDVEGWLRILGFAGGVDEQARVLRVRAVEGWMTLTGSRGHDHEAIDDLLSKVAPEDPMLTGRVCEAQGRFEQAAEAFERAGERDAALRCWREAGRWTDAVRLAEGGTLEDLRWLGTLDDVLSSRPKGHAQRMTEGERRLLEKLSKKLL